MTNLRTNNQNDDQNEASKSNRSQGPSPCLQSLIQVPSRSPQSRVPAQVFSPGFGYVAPASLPRGPVPKPWKTSNVLSP